MSAARVRRSSIAGSPGAAGPVFKHTETVVPFPSAAELASFTDPEPDPLGWQGSALCAETDPEAFFPDKGESTREAKRVCRSCEVRAECLDYALANDERYGVWGGMSERERRRLKREAA